MGVSGFTNWLKYDQSSQAASLRDAPRIDLVPKNVLLLVDGSSLAYHILNGMGHDARREFGGDYSAIALATRSWAQNLLGVGYRLHVVKDGHASPLKNRTLARRRATRDQKICKLVECLNSSERPANAEGLPAPMLLLTQVYGTLWQMRNEYALQLTFQQASGEADDLLAELARTTLEEADDHATTQQRIVLSDDSDFFFCSSIKFSLLHDFCADQPCQIFTSRFVSESLGIPEAHLANFAISIGNDLCPGLPLDNFGTSDDYGFDATKEKQKVRKKSMRITDFLQSYYSGTSFAKASLESDAECNERCGSKQGAVESRTFYAGCERASVEGLELFSYNFGRGARSSGLDSDDDDIDDIVENEANFVQADYQSLLELAHDGLKEIIVSARSCSRVSRKAVANAPSLLAALLALAQKQVDMFLADCEVEFRGSVEGPIHMVFCEWCSSLNELISLDNGGESGDVIQSFPAELSLLIGKILSDRSPNTFMQMMETNENFVVAVIEQVQFASAQHASSRSLGGGAQDWLDYCIAFSFSSIVQALLRRAFLDPVAEVESLPSDYFACQAFFPSRAAYAHICEQAYLNIHKRDPQTAETALRNVSARLSRASIATGMLAPLAPREEATPQQSSSFSTQSRSRRGTQSRSTSSMRGRMSSGQAASSASLVTETPVVSITVANSAPLPIDHHREKILSQILRSRVTVIQGETGSGKSSRAPLMLLEEAFAAAQRDGLPAGKLGPKSDMFVSQPRRIAARSLSVRVRDTLRPDLRGLTGLRLGGGVREETSSTCLWYVTAGYFVRKLAGNPEYFDSFSHIFLDEVHERSVEMDVLCLLAKRLIASHPSIRLILMSATLQAKVFQEYFGLADPPLFVGVKRFPLGEHFLDSDLLVDLVKDDINFRTLANIAESIDSKVEAQQLFSSRGARRVQRQPFSLRVDPNIKRSLVKVCVSLVCSIARAHEGAILIFVSGLSDISALFNEFEQINLRLMEQNIAKQLAATAGEFDQGLLPLSYLRLVAIHSNIPYEEQLGAWNQSSDPGERKVIIATNSAESSITLPDVDTVICFGTHKTVVYDQINGTQTLAERYISRASAVQRAGRTARTRPGTVFRMYTQMLWEQMQEFDTPEIANMPMDKVVLDLKAMVSGPVKPLLNDMIDPPEEDVVDIAMERLYDFGLISAREDSVSALTRMGNFASALGVELKVGMLVFRGALLGVVPEALAIAAAISAPQSPYRVANPLILKVHEEFHRVIQTTKESQYVLGKGLHSDLLAMVRLISLWSAIRSQRARRRLARQLGLAFDRTNHLITAYKHLTRTAARLLGKPAEALELEHPATLLTDPKRVNRVLLVMFQACSGIVSMEASDEGVLRQAFLDPSDLTTPWYSVTLNPKLSKNQTADPLTLTEAATLFPPGVKWALIDRCHSDHSNSEHKHFIPFEFEIKKRSTKDAVEYDDSSDYDESDDEPEDESDDESDEEGPLEINDSFCELDSTLAFLASIRALVRPLTEIRSAIDAIGPKSLEGATSDTGSKPTEHASLFDYLAAGKSSKRKRGKEQSDAGLCEPFADAAWVTIASQRPRHGYYYDYGMDDYYEELYEELDYPFQSSSSEEDEEDSENQGEKHFTPSPGVMERMKKTHGEYVFHFLFLPREEANPDPLACLDDETFCAAFPLQDKFSRISQWADRSLCILQERLSTPEVVCYAMPRARSFGALGPCVLSPLKLMLVPSGLTVFNSISSPTHRHLSELANQLAPVDFLKCYHKPYNGGRFQELYVQCDAKGEAPLGIKCLGQYSTRRDREARGKVLMTPEDQYKRITGFTLAKGVVPVAHPMRVHIPQGPGSCKEANLFAKTNFRLCIVDGCSSQHVPQIDKAPMVAMSHEVRLIETPQAKKTPQAPMEPARARPDMAILNQLTMLPPKWIDFALPCISSSAPGGSAHAKTQTCHALASRLHKLSMESGDKVVEDAVLISMADSIFEGFTSRAAQSLPEDWLRVFPHEVDEKPTNPSGLGSQSVTSSNALLLAPTSQVTQVPATPLQPATPPQPEPNSTSKADRPAKKQAVGDFLSDMSKFV